MNTPATPAKFKVGSVYSMRSPCDHACVWSYEVTRRTAASVWLRDTRTGEVIRRRVSLSFAGDYEMCAPLGTYSMCPILTADSPAPATPAADAEAPAAATLPDLPENVVRLSDWRALKAANA